MKRESWKQVVSPAGNHETGSISLRVLRQDRDLYLLQGEGCMYRGELSGWFRHNVDNSTALPVVGDFVEGNLDENGERFRIHAVVDRRNALMRKVPVSGGRRMVNGAIGGGRTEAQVLAANIDTAFIVVGADQDANPRRLERYLLMLQESRIPAVVLINKTDLPSDQGAAVEKRLRAVLPVQSSIPVLRLSALKKQGLQQMEPWLLPGNALVFIGSSGAGKTSLLTSLGAATGPISALSDATHKGRHTTTRRESFWLPSGCLVIDTPGIRELQLWCEADNVNTLFADLVELAQECRYPKCSHTTEPDCAIQYAVEAGEVDSGRVIAWKRLSAEGQRLENRRREKGQGARPHRSVPTDAEDDT